jgi:hypothetical protein
MRRDRCVGSANGANQASILARTVARANVSRGAAHLKRDWLKTRTVCPSRTVALGGGLKRACGDRARGGEAGEPPSPRVPSTVLDRARRARVGAAEGATAVARLEERRATRDCAGLATPRALAATMLLTSSAFFERVCVSSRGARRRKERRAGTRTRQEAGPSRGDETRAWRRASKWPVEEQDAKYRRRLRSDPRSGKRFLKVIFLTARHLQILRRFC